MVKGFHLFSSALIPAPKMKIMFMCVLEGWTSTSKAGLQNTYLVRNRRAERCMNYIICHKGCKRSPIINPPASQNDVGEQWSDNIKQRWSQIHWQGQVSSVGLSPHGESMCCCPNTLCRPMFLIHLLLNKNLEADNQHNHVINPLGDATVLNVSVGIIGNRSHGIRLKLELPDTRCYDC